jgi:Sap, sulfolipid-1-addressing protein
VGLEIYVALAVLALIDSTSFGTLLIPIWLLLSPGRLRSRRIVLYLAVIGVFYLVLGVALTAGAMMVIEQADSVLDSTAVGVIQLVIGATLLVLGLTIEPLTKAGKEKRAAKRAARQAESGPTRLERWRARATAEEGPATGLVGLALTAGAIEAASMLPYLGAIGLITTSDLSLTGSVAVLLGYCLVMVAPALVLLAARVLLHERLSPTLTRVEAWMSRNSRELTAWILFLVGFYLAGSAAAALGLTN